MDFTTHGQLLTAFKAGLTTTVTLDPEPAYMTPDFLRDLRELLNGLTAFLPSEDELRSLFWGKTNDLWEMAEALGSYGCELVVIKQGGQGQMLYDAVGKHRWEIPAYPSRMADPTGAGDAFCGGFLAGYRESYEPLDAALYGNVSASLTVEGSGPFYPLEVMPGLAQARLEALEASKATGNWYMTLIASMKMAAQRPAKARTCWKRILCRGFEISKNDG